MLSMYSPTAVHACCTQDTPRRWLATAPAGAGVGWIFQTSPFHDSASVASTPGLTL